MQKRMQTRRKGERLSRVVLVNIEPLLADAPEHVMWIRKHFLNALDACYEQSINEGSK